MLSNEKDLAQCQQLTEDKIGPEKYLTMLGLKFRGEGPIGMHQHQVFIAVY